MAETFLKRFEVFRSPALAVAVVYFFLNCLFLPEGLQYTTFLTPVFLWWMQQNGLLKLKPYLVFVAITAAYALVHFKIGVQPWYYLRSWFLTFCSFTFAVAVHSYLVKEGSAGKIFNKILLYNLCLIPVALIALFVPPFNEYFWYYKPISPGIKAFPRLSMLSYEAAYYSFLFTPVFLYHLLNIMFRHGESAFSRPTTNDSKHSQVELKHSGRTTTPDSNIGNPVFVLAAVLIPLALSLSFGVILILGITIGLIFVFYYPEIINSKTARIRFATIFFIGIAASLAILFVWPDNPVAHRVFNVLNNKDTSLRGRTNEAFHIAWMIASMKSRIFGVGFGQIKVLGHDLIVNYYKYYEPHPVVRIPNTLAETLAMFGIAGLALRMFADVYFFFSTRTYSNRYRLAVFIFVFLYQFTGSFMVNIVELVCWVIAFTRAFPEFDIKKSGRATTERSRPTTND